MKTIKILFSTLLVMLACPAWSSTLSEQKTCAEQARKSFHEYKHDDDGTDYTSHFDASTATCYMLVHYFKADAHSIASSDTVYDAFEGRSYASYIWINSAPFKKFWEVKPMECSIKPRRQEEVTCKDSYEFESLIDKYFGIGR